MADVERYRGLADEIDESTNRINALQQAMEAAQAKLKNCQYRLEAARLPLCILHIQNVVYKIHPDKPYYVCRCVFPAHTTAKGSEPVADADGAAY